MSLNVSELRSMSTERLIELHDAKAVHTSTGVNYYLEELARRDSQEVLNAVAANTSDVREQVEQFARLTKRSGDRMEILTYVIAALTLANLLAVLLAA